jgi:hypothetical protein
MVFPPKMGMIGYYTTFMPFGKGINCKFSSARNGNK